MLTFSAATRAARCVVGTWTQSNVILRRTIVLQCPMNRKLPPNRDLAFKSAALAVLSSQRSLLTSAQMLSESAKATPATAPSEAEGGEKAKYQPLTKWQKWGYIFFGVNMVSLVIGSFVVFALPDKDESGNEIKDEHSSLPFPTQYVQRLKAKVFKTQKDLVEPFSDKLLPDPLPEPYYQPKYTVLVELTGMLVHADWTHKHGWRFQKRPGVDMLVSQLGYPQFELVVYTKENALTFYPIIEGLDPGNQFLMYKLFRDATRYVDGGHKKDLGALNRDLRKVILVDYDAESTMGHRDNALVIKKFEGDNTDTSLIGLTQLLMAIKESDVEDVREVLAYYRQFDDPIEAFRENQRKLQEELAIDEKRTADARMGKSGTGSFVSGLGLSRGFRRN